MTLKIDVPVVLGWVWVAVRPVTLYSDPEPPTSAIGTLIVIVPEAV